MEQLFQLEPLPAAVFVAFDRVALGALQCHRRRHLRVPENMATVVFDNIPLAEFIASPLTTARLPDCGQG